MIIELKMDIMTATKASPIQKPFTSSFMMSRTGVPMKSEQNAHIATARDQRRQIAMLVASTSKSRVTTRIK
jgi:hypothetical protein